MSSESIPVLFIISFQALKIICQDMFFARSRASTTTKSLINREGASSQGRTILESAFKYTDNSSDKANVVGELLNLRARAPVEAHFEEPVSYHSL